MRGETYEEFVEKFKPKKTTDDCYTPQGIYEVIKDWVCEKYDVKEESIMRPFKPGGTIRRRSTKKGAWCWITHHFRSLRKYANITWKEMLNSFCSHLR